MREAEVKKNVVILVRQEGLGSVASADREFGLDMFDRFLHSLESQAIQPQAICLYTEGVKLAGEGSKAVFGLRMIQGMGARIMICKTCLERYGLLDKVSVGEVRSMAEISKILLEADQVVTV
jgi:sulfur relay (sulfurtransferase) complex TusBCD TusD component (DsrE family)